VAVDAYETVLRARVAEVVDGLTTEEQRLEDERRAVEARLAELRRERDGVRRTFGAWCRDKRERELAWAEALTCLAADDSLEQSWVSISAELKEEE
jgi:hypothetical protein